MTKLELEELDQLNLIVKILKDRKSQDANDFSGFGKMKNFQTYYYNLNNEKKAPIPLSIEDGYNRLVDVFTDLYGEGTAKNAIKDLILMSSSQYYTPKFIADELAQLALTRNPDIKTVLEPSCGNGCLIDSLLELKPDLKIVGIEKDFISAEIAKIKYQDNQNVSIENRGFEEYDATIGGNDYQFDLVISNIPFGNTRLRYQERDLLIEPFFFAKGQDLVKNQGDLIYITGRGFLNGRGDEISKVREEFSNQMEVNHCFILPNGTFQDTSTDSNLIVAKKTGEIDIDITKLTERSHELGGYKGSVWVNNGLRETNTLGFKVLGGYGVPEVKTNRFGGVVYYYNKIQDEAAYRDNVMALLGTNDIERNKTIVSPVNTDEKLEANIIQDIDSVRRSLVPIKTKAIVIKDVAQLDLFSQANIKNGIDLDHYLSQLNIRDYKSAELTELFLNKNNEDEVMLFTIKYSNTNTNQLHYVTLLNTVNDLDKQAIDYPARQYYNGHRQEVISFKTNELFSYYDYTNYKDLTIIEYADRYRDAVEETYKNSSSNDINSIIKYNLIHHGDFFGIKQPEEVESIEISIDRSKENKEFIKLLPIDKTNEAYSLAEKNRLILLTKLYDGIVWIRASREDSAKRMETKKVYEEIVSKYGNLNERSNKRFINNYVDSQKAIDLFSAELFIGGKWVNSGLLNEPFYREIKPQNTREWYELMINNWSKIDMDWLSSATNLTKKELVEELSDKIIFNSKTEEYELIDNILKGNLYDRLKEYSDVPSIAALIREKTPPMISYEQLEIKLTEQWLGDNIYSEFADSLFNANSGNFNIKYVNENLLFQSEKIPPKALNEYYIRSDGRNMNGVDLLQYAMQGIYPTFNYKVEGKQYTDTKAVLQSKNLIEQIKKEWYSFLVLNKEKYRENLERKYNYLYNATITNNSSAALLEYSDADLAADNIERLNGKQVEGIQFIMKNFGGLIDHEVGTGKTLQICFVAHYMRKTGKVNSDEAILVVAPKASIPQLVQTYSRVFPNDFILYPDKNDFNRKQKEIFLSRVKNEVPDVVFMTPEQFSLIDPTLETYEKYEKKAIEEYKAILDELYKNTQLNKDLIASINEKIVSKEGKIQEKLIKHSLKKSAINFSDLNVGFMIVDEAHIFKNLGYQTIHSRVKGLNTAKGSNNALNLKLAALDIQSQRGGKDFGLALYTGTPISNSVMEAFVFMDYLIPNRLKELGISKFDSFASLFFEKSYDVECNIGGNQFNEVERFRAFDKIPECAKLYQEMAHYVNGEMAEIDRPDRHLINIMIQQDEPLKEAIGKVRDFIKGGSYDLNGETISAKTDKSIMLEAYNKMQKVTLYAKLENVHFEIGNNKLKECAKHAVIEYQKSSSFKGTQMIFLDMGVPTGSQLNLYQKLKHDLMQLGVPENEIEFIHNVKDESKNDFYNSVNRGDCRILISSRAKGGVGINVQERMVAIHLVDMTNRMLLDIQAEGRGVRQGNKFIKEHSDNKIPIYRYAVEKSGDINVLNSQSIKEEMCKQIRIPSGVRKMQEGEFSTEHGFTKAAFISELMGDDCFIRKAKLEKEYYKLTSLEEYNRKENYNQQGNVAKYEKMVEQGLSVLEDYKRIKEFLPEKPLNKDGELGQLRIYFNEHKKYEEKNGAKIEIPLLIVEQGAMFQKHAVEVQMNSENLGKSFACIGHPESIIQFSFERTNHFNSHLIVKNTETNEKVKFIDMEFFSLQTESSIGNTISRRINTIEEQIDRLEKGIKENIELIDSTKKFLETNQFKEEDKARLEELRSEIKEVNEYIINLNKEEEKNYTFDPVEVITEESNELDEEDESINDQDSEEIKPIKESRFSYNISKSLESEEDNMDNDIER
jgi:hypothetical protein